MNKNSNYKLDCNNKNLDYIFKKINIKNIVMDYIFSMLDFKYIKEKYLTQQTINNIDNINFVVEPIIKGIRCLALIFKNKNNYYSCLIEKKYLLNDKEQINLSEIKISNFDIKFSNIRIYNGTILDGVYIPNDNNFIINDIYYIEGENLLNTPLKNKFIQFKSYLNNFQMGNFNIFINNFILLENFNNETIKELEKTLQNKNKSYNINNLIIGYKFLSLRSNIILNYLVNNNNIDEIKKNKYNNNNKNIIKKDNIKKDKEYPYNNFNNKPNEEEDNSFLNEHYEELNNIKFEYKNQPLKSNINYIPQLDFMYGDNSLYLRCFTGYNIKNKKPIYLPYKICEYDSNISELKNEAILDKNKFYILKCKITNDGIIPFNITTAVDRPDDLNSLIELLDLEKN